MSAVGARRDDVIFRELQLRGEPLSNFPDERLLTIGQVAHLIGVSRMTIRRWWAAGQFPEPIKVGGRLIRWTPESVTGWVDQRPKPNIPIEA